MIYEEPSMEVKIFDKKNIVYCSLVIGDKDADDDWEWDW